MFDDVGEAAAFKEVIDDLALRFVVNCPPEEQESFERLLFQVEAAFWFYDDQYREIWPNTYPKMTMLDFAQAMFKHCELLTKFAPQVPKIYEAFTEYKNQIPTCGAVLLNGDRTKALFVQGFKRHSWLFPKGKIDKDEDKASCAAREVLEEVGFDIAGLLDADAFIEVEPMKGHALVRLYIVDGVAEGTHFETHTKKEISGIEWFRLAELPTPQHRRLQDPSRSASGTPSLCPRAQHVDRREQEAKKKAAPRRSRWRPQPPPPPPGRRCRRRSRRRRAGRAAARS